MEILKEIPLPLLIFFILLLIPILFQSLFGKPEEKDHHRTVLKKIKKIVDEELRK